MKANAINHAFGGAIALAYWTEEPRGTRDIDVNLFVPAADPDAALAALPAGVKRSSRSAAAAKRDGQVRLWWADTPVDLFFDYAPIHRDAERDLRIVPYEGIEIPVLGPLELAVFKAMSDRSRDWADIEEMFAAGSLDVGDLHRAVNALAGRDDPRHARIDVAAARAAS
ncbi:MAG: hypothetical protein ACXWEA_07265 [Solirubrobacterales bacterium]